MLKWTLNRSEQAANTGALLNLCGISINADAYKPCRPSQILLSEKLVSNVVEVLTDEYINPFDPSIEKDHLYNLSSGEPLSSESADRILKVHATGRNLAQTFIDKRLCSNGILFHHPISRNKFTTFSNCKHKVAIKNNSIKAVEVNRNILATLVSYNIRTGKSIDFEKALMYPLSPVALSLCNADGTKRQTNKSKLAKSILAYTTDESTPDVIKTETAYIIDLMAVIRTMKDVPDTFEDLSWKLAKSLPTGFKRIDIVADTYQQNSIKNAERAKRGSSEKLIIKSSKSKIPRNFNNFLSNGENKTRMINLIFETLTEEKVKVLNLLKSTRLYLSNDNTCTLLTLSDTLVIEDLCSNQEEADTKLVLHALHAINESRDAKVNIRSPSGDTDVLLLVLVHLYDHKEKVLLDNGSGTNRKQIWLGNFNIESELLQALIGFHSFTGNDYVSSFFRKGKDLCWRLLEKQSKFQNAFATLGSSWHLSDETWTSLEEYVCCLYGVRGKNVDSVRYKLFTKKNQREHKVCDLSVLPPCRSVLYQHTLRANTISMIWKSSAIPVVDMPDISDWVEPRRNNLLDG